MSSNQRHWYNNGEIETWCSECPDGFSPGRLPFSEKAKENMSKSSAIRRMTDEQRLLRRQKISATKQAKSPEEKAEYANKISVARKGKCVGRAPWNKGKHGVQVVWNKGKKVTLKPESIESMKEKQYATKKKNNSFHTSKPEDDYYNLLCEQYGENDVIRQYKEDRYPFSCDFYIPSIDLFIEYNGTWTHGGRPYDPNDEDCQKQLTIWQEKAKTSNYYKNAISVWTELDVRKLKTAIDNNLNYRVIYKKGLETIERIAQEKDLCENRVE